MIGKTISHYKILEKLGEGGMGVVYKAEDIKLERAVALKFLPPHLSNQEDEKRRFIREAKAASALEHSNICTIHEIDETNDGQLFIVMSYLEGKTLREKIEAAPLKVEEAINITIQIAEGLKQAHEKGIVHRDIKPANIMITKDGTVKIMDFGLAKMWDKTKLTQMGTTLGTFAYMSPEQSRGEEIDRRTDIWSLGVVLFEMLTGQLPFKGDYEQAVVYSLINEQPQPVTSLRSGIPMELERIVNKTLSKNPDERYQHDDELIVDLRKVKTTKDYSGFTTFPIDPKKKSRKLFYIISDAGLIVAIFILLWILLQNKSGDSDTRKLIAVLPFHPITSSEENKNFAEGIHDDILTQLSKISELKVIARTSVMRYMDTRKSIKEIGAELGVKTILEGSTRRSGNMIRVTAQLIDVETEEHLWADTYDRPYNDIFAIQSDVAQKIANALQIKLAKKELHSIQTKPTENLQAWEYFQKGKYFWHNYYNYEGNLKSAEMFQKACELDTNFALAFAWQATTYLAAYSLTPYLNQDTLLMKFESALANAIILAPEIPEINIAKAMYFRNVKNDYNAAFKESEIANIKRPNDADILNQISIYTNLKGNKQEALKLALEAHELDPKGSSGLDILAGVSIELDRYNDAEQWADIMIANNPENAQGYIRKLQIIITVLGDLKLAEDLLGEAKKIVTMEKSRLAYWECVFYFYKRDYNRAIILSNTLEPSTRFYWHAILSKSMSKDEEAKAYFDSLRIANLELIKKRPGLIGQYPTLNLAIAYAALGYKTTALNEIAKLDNNYGINSVMSVTYSYILLGDNNSAIQFLEMCASKLSGITPTILRLDPRVDLLRSDPRFKKVIQIAEERIKRNKQ